MIYINGKFLGQKITGVQRFASEISKVLIRDFEDYRIVLPIGVEIDSQYYPSDKLEYYGKGNLNIWEQIHLPRFLHLNNNPLLLTFTGLGPLFYKKKFVTVHDLSFLEYPEWFSISYRFAYKLLTPITTEYSKQIITVSEYSKRIISNKLKNHTSRIAVINNAVSRCNCKPIEKEKIVLAVGSIDPRKNLLRLIKAFEKWGNSDYRLVIIGGYQESFSKIEFGSHRNVEFLGYVDESILHHYYNISEIFVYPTLYEGFGIPPLEAMMHGTAVIASNVTSLPEVCKDAAYYIDPLSLDSIVDGLNTLADSKEIKDQLIEKGFRNIQRFSWENSADSISKLVFSNKLDTSKTI